VLVKLLALAKQKRLARDRLQHCVPRACLIVVLLSLLGWLQVSAQLLLALASIAGTAECTLAAAEALIRLLYVMVCCWAAANRLQFALPG
jgi:hypothetical protein